MASNDLLIVYPGSLYPVSDGAARRALDMMGYLRANGFRVVLVTPDPGEHAQAVARVCDDLVSVPPSNPGPPPAWSIKERNSIIRSPGWFGRRKQGLETQRNRALELVAAKTGAQLKPRAAIAHFARTAYCLETMPAGTLRIVDTHFVQHARLAAAKKAGANTDPGACTREEEVEALQHADLILAITPGEAATLHQMCPAVQVLLVSHAVSVTPSGSSAPASRDVLVVASGGDHNVRGLQKFLADAWPSIRKNHPDATLTVCGRVGEHLDKPADGVQCAGVVEDLDPYYARAAIVINPVLYSVGLAVKTIEALARGRALVCTPEGLRGLEHAGDVPCRVAADGAQMAAAVSDLLAEVPRRHALERRALEFARAKFSPAAAYGPLGTRLGKPS